MARQSIELRNAPGNQKIIQAERQAAAFTRAVCHPDAPSELVTKALINQLGLPDLKRFGTTTVAVKAAEFAGTFVGNVQSIPKRFGR